MSWTYEIALRGAPEAQATLTHWFATGPRPTVAALPDLASADLYTPAQGSARDPYNHDSAGPLMLLMLDFPSRAALAASMDGHRIAKAIGEVPAGVTATGAAFERRFYPVGEGAAPASLDAPFSYVVRYHRPADDEAAFVANYLATHPVTQAMLPGIRAIMCYLPLHDLHHRAGAARGLTKPDYMIGNEVAFDHIEAFNVAMASPVRQELRAHYHAFPRFTGGNTHYPMTRVRVAG
jgi:hypothetical protein